MLRRLVPAVLVVAAVALACQGDGVTGIPTGKGALDVHLTDRSFPFDSLKAVNVFVERIDARFEEDEKADSDDSVKVIADRDRDHDDAEHEEGSTFVTLASPNAVFNLLDLRNGVTTFLGTAVTDTGTIRDLRIVIDPSKSSIVLKDSTTLTGTANPFSRFPAGSLLIIRVHLDDGIVVKARAHVSMVVDFDLEHSFEMREGSIRHGLFFLPFVTARHGDDH